MLKFGCDCSSVVVGIVVVEVAIADMTEYRRQQPAGLDVLHRLVDALRQLAADGTIGAVADAHFSVMGSTDPAAMTQLLSDRAGRKVELAVPQRGEKAELVENAARNARESLARRLAENSTQNKLLAGLAAERHGEVLRA